MTNERIIRDDINYLPLPDDADATALMLDLIRACTTDALDTMQYWGDRFDMISDYDDYATAALRLASATLDRFLAHIDATPRDALLALLDDTDFLLDLMTIDMTIALHDAIDIQYND